jgi:hypothetical protein
MLRRRARHSCWDAQGGAGTRQGAALRPARPSRAAAPPRPLQAAPLRLLQACPRRPPHPAHRPRMQEVGPQTSAEVSAACATSFPGTHPPAMGPCQVTPTLLHRPARAPLDRGARGSAPVALRCLGPRLHISGRFSLMPAFTTIVNARFNTKIVCRTCATPPTLPARVAPVSPWAALDAATAPMQRGGNQPAGSHDPPLDGSWHSTETTWVPCLFHAFDLHSFRPANAAVPWPPLTPPRRRRRRRRRPAP